jgi:hypothetical protein
MDNKCRNWTKPSRKFKAQETMNLSQNSWTNSTKNQAQWIDEFLNQ